MSWAAWGLRGFLRRGVFVLRPGWSQANQEEMASPIQLSAGAAWHSQSCLSRSSGLLLPGTLSMLQEGGIIPQVHETGGGKVCSGLRGWPTCQPWLAFDPELNVLQKKQSKNQRHGETRTRGTGRAPGISLGVQQGAAMTPLPLVVPVTGKEPICRP